MARLSPATEGETSWRSHSTKPTASPLARSRTRRASISWSASRSAMPVGGSSRSSAWTAPSGPPSMAARGKAVASAAFGRPSGDLTERADHPTFRGIVAADGGHMILGRGGVPIMRDGQVIGACGVGGGTGEEDEDCARAGVARI